MTPWMTFWLGFSPHRSLQRGGGGKNKKKKKKVGVFQRFLFFFGKPDQLRERWGTYFLISFSSIRMSTACRGSIMSFLHVSRANCKRHTKKPSRRLRYVGRLQSEERSRLSAPNNPDELSILPFSNVKNLKNPIHFLMEFHPGTFTN